MSERIASTLLDIVYKDLTSLASGVDDALQVLRRMHEMLEAEGAGAEAELDKLVAIIGELNLPNEVTDALREVADSRRDLHQKISETLPISMLEGTLDYIVTRQKMIRDEGFAAS